MIHIPIPAALSLVVALGASSAAWTARLEGREGSKISGTAQVEAVPVMPKDTVPADSTTTSRPASNELRVTVTLSKAPENASLSWYLYSGSCSAASAGDAESIVGLPSSYAPIKIDGSGNGTTTVTIREAQVGTGTHYVGVLAGGKVAACGNLEPHASTGE